MNSFILNKTNSICVKNNTFYFLTSPQKEIKRIELKKKEKKDIPWEEVLEIETWELFLLRSLCPANLLLQLLFESSNSDTTWNLYSHNQLIHHPLIIIFFSLNFFFFYAQPYYIMTIEESLFIYCHHHQRTAFILG